jgi:Acyl-CoA reductase (LuxC)
MQVTSFVPESIPNIEIEKLITANFLNTKPLHTFDEIIIDFLSSLSKKILTVKETKNYPELVALAYWLRKANIVHIINKFKEKIGADEVIVPRGVAFHIAPSNVDSIFLYSWTLSMLAGNLNIVRVSQDSTEQMNLLLSIIREMTQAKEWEAISQRNIVLTYPRDNSINKFISTRSDLRVIWGGDNTVKSIKELPSKPSAKDVTFPDKFSYSVIDSASYNKSEDRAKEHLAKNFYNDSYWFDQMACSSPRFVFFTGSKKESTAASKKFWDLLSKELASKNKFDTIDIAMEKLVYMYDTISRTSVTELPEKIKNTEPTVLRIDKENIADVRESCGGGFFFECFIEKLEDLIILINKKDQTLTYFGFEQNALKELAKKINGAGIDRIVPIGQALNFSPLWDGYSLLDEFTKKINII